MYASRLIAFFLVFLVALASTTPLPYHHRRERCRRRTSASVAGATSTRAALEVPSPTGSPTPSVTSSSSPSSSAKPPKQSSKPDDSGSDASNGSDSSSGGLLGGLLGMLFPIVEKVASWTTIPSAPGALKLADSTFRPEHAMDLPHPYVDAPDGKLAMQAHYPKGSYNFQHEPLGGFSFYATGPENVDLTTAKEVTAGYSVFFPEGFKWQLGGKLPGLYGGNSEEEALSCSGGSRSDDCFSVRLMWREESKGEVYTYLPPSSPANDAVCDVKPQSICNKQYGASVGRGAFSFATGDWTTVTERVKLNDIGKENGEIELFVNGKSVMSVAGLVLRTSDQGRIMGLMMQTFFGGSDESYASPEDQDVWFADFSVAITQTL